jgi:hypothetical protein
LYLSTTGRDNAVAVSVLLSNGGRRAGKERGRGTQGSRKEEKEGWKKAYLVPRRDSER